MDQPWKWMALKRVADTVPFGLTDEIQWVGGRGGAWEARTQVWVEAPLVQILVVVANIQARSLKGEVGKGSTRTLIGRGWVAPKRGGNCTIIKLRKGSQLKFWRVGTGIVVTRHFINGWGRARWRVPRTELSFLFKFHFFAVGVEEHYVEKHNLEWRVLRFLQHPKRTRRPLKPCPPNSQGVWKDSSRGFSGSI